MKEAMKAAFDLAYKTIGEDAWHDAGCDKIFVMGWQAALSQQPAQPVRIEFGKGLVGVHTIMNEGRTGIALTNLGTGVIGAPTLHENGTPCDQNLVEMDFANSESCQVLIDELSGLFQAQPTGRIMGLLGAACYVIRKYEPESNLLQKIRNVTFDRKPALPSCADLKIKSQVIRYSLDEGGKGINFDEFGNYVHICDYEVLSAENKLLKEAIKAHEDAFTESLGDTLELIADRDKLQQLLMTALDTGRAAIAERDVLKARNVELEPAFEKASKSCSSALLALAHTSLDNPLYSDAYEEVNAMMPIFMELRKK